MPDVIVRETTEFGGLLAAQALGLPTAALQVGSPSLMTPPVLAATGVALDEARERLGLRADPHRTRLLPSTFDSFYPGPSAAAASLPKVES